MSDIDIIFEDGIYQFISQYVVPEMLVCVPALLFIGWMIKSTPHISNWMIPYILTVLGVVAGISITKEVVDGTIQGILVTAMSTLAYNLYTQWKKKDDEPKD